uniref:Putative secreted protein n=1 Tax=Ixodes ricinus TaxID=34613 RepID=A0A6B0ULC1_IXORI
MSLMMGSAPRRYLMLSLGNCLCLGPRTKASICGMCPNLQAHTSSTARGYRLGASRSWVWAQQRWQPSRSRSRSKAARPRQEAHARSGFRKPRARQSSAERSPRANKGAIRSCKQT